MLYYISYSDNVIDGAYDFSIGCCFLTLICLNCKLHCTFPIASVPIHTIAYGAIPPFPLVSPSFIVLIASSTSSLSISFLNYFSITWLMLFIFRWYLLKHTSIVVSPCVKFLLLLIGSSYFCLLFHSHIFLIFLHSFGSIQKQVNFFSLERTVLPRSSKSKLTIVLLFFLSQRPREVADHYGYFYFWGRHSK